MGNCNAEDLAVESKDMTVLGTAESCGILDEGFQNGLEIKRGATDHLEDFAGGGLLLEGLGEVAVPGLQFLEQADVLDGDDGLVGKGLDHLDLLLGEWPDLVPMDYHNSNQDPLPQHGDPQQSPETSRLLALGPLILRISQDVVNVDRRALQGHPPHQGPSPREALMLGNEFP